MIECYYSGCKYHPKDEPFCSEEECLVTEQEIVIFKKERLEYLKQFEENIDV